MSPQLEELLARVVFARDQTLALAGDLRVFEAESVEGHFAHTPLADGWFSNVTWDVFVLQKAPVPVRLRSHAGVIANELRACLDGLACHLAERNGRSSKSTYFPISKSKAIFEQDGMRKISALSLADQADVVSLRPYRGGDDLLWGLHEADRRRKHQRLGACAVASAEMAIGEHMFGGQAAPGALLIEREHFGGDPPEQMWWDPTRLDRLEVGRKLQIAGALPRSWKAKFRFQTAYVEPAELAGREVSSTLTTFADRVENIISLFA